MNPIIKWPGGKTREIGRIEPLIPPFERYVEPFFGGGAMFFHLSPRVSAINDISSSLMNFYRLIKAQDRDLHRLLLCYDSAFSRLIRLVDQRSDTLIDIFLRLSGGEIAKDAARGELRALCGDIRAPMGEALVELTGDMDGFCGALLDMAQDKLLRTVENHKKKPFSEADLRENLLTGFTSGFYMFFRGIFNDLELGRLRDASPQYRAANFYFIREYCYGSMFRYNSAGEFNIPYGGMSYNRKNLLAKIESMWSGDMARLFAGADIRCMDFEDFFSSLELRKTDFMFLDPPYDTDFSDYEGRDFTHRDQERLAAALRTTRAKFILVIKNTEFIRGLYEGDFNILSFDKHYTYNVRSRNDRDTEHLVITNFDP